MRGSWNRNPASGYEIVRIHYEDGKPQKIEPFLTGFLTDGGKTHIARPVGLAIARDGSLLMADDANGVIYRIAYTGDAKKAAGEKNPPREVMEAQANKGVGVPLAKDRPETETDKAIEVASQSFANDEAMPQKHSEYADGVSPALRWDAVPGALSYAIIMEDPDSAPIKPFVHWLAWNIPGTVNGLPEGLQEQIGLWNLPPRARQHDCELRFHHGENHQCSLARNSPMCALTTAAVDDVYYPTDWVIDSSAYAPTKNLKLNHIAPLAPRKINSTD
jgi:hypothetical protein